MDLLAGVLAGTAGVAAVWATMRFAAPHIGNLLSGWWNIRGAIEADRERVIANLRAEVADLYRRNQDAVNRCNAAEAKADDALRRLSESEEFIARYVRRTRP